MTRSRGTTRTSSVAHLPPSRRARAAANRSRRAASSGRLLARPRVEKDEPVVEPVAHRPDGGGQRPRVGRRDAGPHRRVAAGQARGPGPAARGQCRRGRPARRDRCSRCARDRLHQGRGDHERKVADGGNGGIVVDRGHAQRPCAAGPGQLPPRGRRRPRHLPAAERRPTAGRGRGRSTPPRSRSSRGPPSGALPRSGDRGSPHARRGAPWCSPRR